MRNSPRLFKFLAATFGCSFIFGAILNAASDDDFPHLVNRDGQHAFYVDGAPYLMLSAQVHNSSAWPAMLPKIWPAMEYLGANTVEIPVYWEQLEPRPGEFDFTLVDTLLAQARQHHLHLVLLWFGTWKNGSAHYLPIWMKQDPVKYPNIMRANGEEVDSPSPYAEATREADKKAFAAFMGHLKTADHAHTVIMVQVENESGAWGAVRDYSPAAQSLFNGPVPDELLNALQRAKDPKASTWSAVFGDDAEEFFHAWSVAKYVGEVAAAGKAMYPLPLYANAALRDPINPGRPPKYESGGPTDNVLAIWKAAAPALDILAPDIYLSESPQYFKVLELYRRPDNPLFVPETGSSLAYSRYFFAALGQGTIGFSPFGLDYSGHKYSLAGGPAMTEEHLAPFALNYHIIGPMMREIARLNFEGKVRAVAEPDDRSPQTFTLGKWNVTVSYKIQRYATVDPQIASAPPLGRALVAQLGENEFIVTGAFCGVAFKPVEGAPSKVWQYLSVDEGEYDKGTFKPIRRWNGDETDFGLNFSSAPQVIHVILGLRVPR